MSQHNFGFFFLANILLLVCLGLVGAVNNSLINNPLYSFITGFFVATFVILLYIGTKPSEE